jgi:hypothetical protein
VYFNWLIRVWRNQVLADTLLDDRGQLRRSCAEAATFTIATPRTDSISSREHGTEQNPDTCAKAIVLRRPKPI